MSVNQRNARPCTPSPHPYHRYMDGPTLDALKRIMERAQPRKSDPAQVRSDWQLVAGWMEEAEHDLRDFETLDTDRRPPLREVR
jgi:hypothetical protein